jgi:glycopeptide antibiotics resistance protein
VSLSIEVIQIFTGRIFDINDIIYNILGTLLGTLLAHLIKKYFPSCSGKFCYE